MRYDLQGAFGRECINQMMLDVIPNETKRATKQRVDALLFGDSRTQHSLGDDPPNACEARLGPTDVSSPLSMSSRAPASNVVVFSGGAQPRPQHLAGRLLRRERNRARSLRTPALDRQVNRFVSEGTKRNGPLLSESRSAC